MIDVPLHVVQSWETRGSYINQGELLVGPLLATHFPELISQADVLWFLDNSSAVSALIKGSSSVYDSCQMAMRAQATFMALRARCWFEHVGTAQNPADGLSRDGYADLWVHEQVSAGLWSPLSVKCIDWDSATRIDLSAYWDQIEALGDA